MNLRDHNLPSEFIWIPFIYQFYQNFLEIIIFIDKSTSFEINYIDNNILIMLANIFFN